MHDDEWCNLLKRYQAAASSFHEAVDRLTLSGMSFQHSWETTEKALVEVGRAHASILNHERRQLAVAAAGRSYEVIPTEELVLGDQGQSGG
jgi:hypothetical protein